jgi:hypothetical protein
MLAMCGMAAWAPGAWATLSLDNTTDTTIAIDSDSHWWNNPTPKTYNGYQYMTYWDAEDGAGDVYMKITRRRLSDDRLDTIRFDTRGAEQILAVPKDGHNALSLGLSPVDGRIHISYSPHSAPHHYGISSAGCLSEATFSNCRESATAALMRLESLAIPARPDRITGFRSATSMPPQRLSYAA